MKKLIPGAFATLILFACGPQERISRETFEQVNNANEVKRLTEVEILEEAMVWGDSISSEAQSQLLSNLQRAISEKGIDGAVEFCHVQALPILDWGGIVAVESPCQLGLFGSAPIPLKVPERPIAVFSVRSRHWQLPSRSHSFSPLTT